MWPSGVRRAATWGGAIVAPVSPWSEPDPRAGVWESGARPHLALERVLDGPVQPRAAREQAVDGRVKVVDLKVEEGRVARAQRRLPVRGREGGLSVGGLGRVRGGGGHHVLLGPGQREADACARVEVGRGVGVAGQHGQAEGAVVELQRRLHLPRQQQDVGERRRRRARRRRGSARRRGQSRGGRRMRAGSHGRRGERARRSSARPRRHSPQPRAREGTALRRAGDLARGGRGRGRVSEEGTEEGEKQRGRRGGRRGSRGSRGKDGRRTRPRRTRRKRRTRGLEEEGLEEDSRLRPPRACPCPRRPPCPRPCPPPLQPPPLC